MDTYDDGHCAAVMLKSGSLLSSHFATWINVLDAVQEGEECFFFLPDGNVVTGPEWCEHVGLPEQQQQQWQELITVKRSNGDIAEGVAVAKVLSGDLEKEADGNVAHPALPIAVTDANEQQSCAAKATQQQGVDEQANTPSKTIDHEYNSTHSTSADRREGKPDIDLAAGQLAPDQQHYVPIEGDRGVACASSNVQQVDEPAVLQDNTLLQEHVQVQDTLAEVTSSTPAESQNFPTAVPHVSVPLQQQAETGDAVDRQPDDGNTIGRQHVASRAVRVTLTNHKTHTTVFALWTNINDMFRPRRARTSTDALFLPCNDDTYQPAMNATPLNASGLARLASMVHTHSAQHQVRLNQRFRAATGHCFYPGMSLAQVTKVVSAGNDSSALHLTKSWDETAVDPVVSCSIHQQVHIRVKAFHFLTDRALFAEARFTLPFSGHVLFAMCDNQYNLRQPEQWVPIRDLFLQAGLPAACSYHLESIWLTQSLQLPSGHVLLPGTSLQQLIEELTKVKAKRVSDGRKPPTANTPSQDTSRDMVRTVPVTLHDNIQPVITQPPTKQVDVSNSILKKATTKPHGDVSNVIHTKGQHPAAVPDSQKFGDGGGGCPADVITRIRTPLSKQQTGNKRPASGLEEEADRSIRQKVTNDSNNQMQTDEGNTEQPGVARRQERADVLASQPVAAKEKLLAKTDQQPLLPSAGNEMNKSQGTGSPMSAASTVDAQPFSPVQVNIQHPPTANTPTPTPKQMKYDKPLPVLPKLDIQGSTVHPLSVVKAWGAICSLLRFLGCSNDAVKHMWLTRQQWGKEGEEKMHDFAASYAELADAVDYRDWEYVKQVLQQQFQLPV